MVPMEPSLCLSLDTARTRDKSFIAGAAPGILHPAVKRGFAYTQRTAWYIQDYTSICYLARGETERALSARHTRHTGPRSRMRRRAPPRAARGGGGSRTHANAYNVALIFWRERICDKDLNWAQA